MHDFASSCFRPTPNPERHVSPGAPQQAAYLGHVCSYRSTDYSSSECVENIEFRTCTQLKIILVGAELLHLRFACEIALAPLGSLLIVVWIGTPDASANMPIPCNLWLSRAFARTRGVRVDSSCATHSINLSKPHAADRHLPLICLKSPPSIGIWMMARLRNNRREQLTTELTSRLVRLDIRTSGAN